MANCVRWVSDLSENPLDGFWSLRQCKIVKADETEIEVCELRRDAYSGGVSTDLLDLDICHGSRDSECRLPSAEHGTQSPVTEREKQEDFPAALRCAFRAPRKPWVTILGHPSNACVRPTDGFTAVRKSPERSSSMADAYRSHCPLILRRPCHPFPPSQHLLPTSVDFNILWPISSTDCHSIPSAD